MQSLPHFNQKTKTPGDMMNYYTSKPVATALLTIGIATGCGSDSNDNNDNTGGGDASVSFSATSTINNLADAVITQNYINLNDAAVQLVNAANSLQDGGATDAEMAAAQQAWKDTRVPWESSEGFLFGPVDSLGIDPALDSWPLNTPDLQGVLANGQAASDYLAFVASAGEDLKGFHAIEFLLFGDGTADNTISAAELADGEPAYLQALAADLQSKTQLLQNAWTVDFVGGDPYATLVKTAGTGNTVYGSKSAVFEELVNGMIGIADEVANAKLAEPFGTSAAQADTSLVESQYSWNSLTDFSNNLQSLLNIYSGTLGYSAATNTISASSNGLYSFVLAHDSTLADRVLTEIVNAQQSIALIKGDNDNSTPAITGSALPFRQQILDEQQRPLIQTAIDATNTVFATLESDVLPLIGNTEFLD